MAPPSHLLEPPVNPGRFNPPFLNSWTNYDGGSEFSKAAFHKDALGRVYLTGLVKSGTALTNIFILPEGFRPPKRLLFAVDSNMSHGRVDVKTDGSVWLDVGSGTWASLDGVSFFVE